MNKAFQTHVARAAKQADVKALRGALGALVKARLRKRQRRPERPPVPIAAQPKPRPQRRSPRRLGRYRAYEVTTKTNYTRSGTWTHHMISVIQAHTDTRAATLANESCDDSKFAAKRLDFNWAADNGYINWK
jgi:hypothetical protein